MTRQHVRLSIVVVTAGVCFAILWGFLHAETVLTADIIIHAPVERVWEVLTDFGAYPEWNPFVREVRGPLLPAGRLTVILELPSGRAVVLSPVLREVTPPARLRLTRRLLLPRLFDVEQTIHVVSLGPARSRVFQRGVYRGLAVQPLEGYLNREVRDGLLLMNLALKWRAEGRPLLVE